MNINELEQKSENELRGERLRLLRHMLSMTILEFSKLCSTGESTIRQWEQGKASGLTEKGAYKVFNALKDTKVEFEIDWLLHNQGIPPTFNEKSENGIIINPEPTLETPDTNFAEEEIHFFVKTAARPVTYIVNNDSMEPFYFNGDILGGCLFSGKDIKLLAGQIVIAQTTDNQTFLRKMNTTNRNNIYRLSVTNTMTKCEPFILECELIAAAYITRLWRNLPSS